MKFKIFQNITFLIFIFLFSLYPLLINSQNLCPYSELQDILQYYIKGINPSQTSKDSSEYKWEYIHCVNNFYNSTFLLREKDPYFNQNAGIFIGSSINLGKLSEEFISNNLTELDETDINTLLLIRNKFDKDAEDIIKNISLDLSVKEINYINEQVYEQYYKEMIEFFESNEKGEKKKLEYGYNFEINLLTFYVKYYGMDIYLNEVKNLLFENPNDLFLLSYFFINIKSDNYLQKKLWSINTLNSNESLSNNEFRHIGIFYDNKISKKTENYFREFLLDFIEIFKFDNYHYSLGNLLGLDFENPKSKKEFYSYIEKHNFCYEYSGKENITKGIEYFKKHFNKKIIENHYYQQHLIIFINDIKIIKEKINIDYFNKKGIQVILFSKIDKKSEEEDLMNLFENKNNIITFYEYEELNQANKTNKTNNYVLALRNLIHFQPHNYIYENNIIQINHINNQNIINNMHNFKITFDQNLTRNINTGDEEDYYTYFHISLIYIHPEDIQNKYKNNANITFLFSKKNPYPDILNYDLANFCLNNTVSSDINESPYINYLISNSRNYFYISIIANDLSYSLSIELKNASMQTLFIPSNGIFGELNISYINYTELIATYSDSIINKECSVDLFSLFKYYSSGVHYKNTADTFNKIIDMNMIGCLYRNVYGPFFEIFKDTIEYEYGPLIGYGINLSKESNIKLFKDKIPLYLINKLQPFLENSITDMSLARKAVEKYNLNLTMEEIYQLNVNYFYNIISKLEKVYSKFDNLSDNLKLAIFLRILEQNPTNQQIDSYLNYLTTNNIDRYLRVLNNTLKSRMSTEESLNFQIMLTETKTIYKPKKCLVSFIIGRSLLWSDKLLELLNKMDNYRISITFFDDKSNSVDLLVDFNEEMKEIENIINNFKNNSEFKTTENIDINLILKQQINLFKYYDEGIKKVIIIISTNSGNKFKYDFKKPEQNLLKKLYDTGVLIFDYSDHINFIQEEDVDYEINFFNSTKNEYIQYVPFLDYNDMSQNYLTLINIINRFPIPINKIQDIYLDLERDETIFYEFDLKDLIKKLIEKKYVDKYNHIKFTFDTTNLKIFFSTKFIFPNNYSNELSFTINEKNHEIFYDLKYLNNTKKFFMAIQTSNRVDNSVMKLEICEKEGSCLEKDFYFTFYIIFAIIGSLIIFYGVYICFCETTIRKENNIFGIK